MVFWVKFIVRLFLKYGNSNMCTISDQSLLFDHYRVLSGNMMVLLYSCIMD